MRQQETTQRMLRRPLAFELRVTPVARGYTPGYPRRLTRDEVRALLEQRLPPRIRQLAATAAVAFGLNACDPHAPREAGRSGGEEPLPLLELGGEAPRAVAPEGVVDEVRSCLQRLADEEHGNGWREYVTVWRSSEDATVAGPRRFIVQIPIAYGNSYNGIFDSSLAREFATEIMAAYGLTPVSARVKQGAVEAVLDGVDAEHAIAFELPNVPPGDDRLFTFSGSAQHAVAESSAETLDAEEAESLRGAGVHLHLADPEPLFDGDQGTAVTTWMLGLIDFLNEATDGPNFDLRLVLDPKGLHADVEPVVVEGEVESIEPIPEVQRVAITSKTRCRVELRVDEAVFAEATREYRLRTVFRRDPFDPNERPTATPNVTISHTQGQVTLVQSIDGEEVRVPTERPGYIRFHLPERFDVTRPFRVEIELPPGKHFVGSRVTITGTN